MLDNVGPVKTSVVTPRPSNDWGPDFCCCSYRQNINDSAADAEKHCSKDCNTDNLIPHGSYLKIESVR